MSYTYAQRKRDTAQTTAAPQRGGVTESGIPNSVRLAALQSGAASPTAAEKGDRVDLPAAMRAKMENAYGMDFSSIKLYQSRALEATGAEAMARGNEIAFAPGKLDFSSFEGQARLGHELSHVASQARGEVTGGGFLNNPALEHRADAEGAMAARGESVYSAAPYGGAVAPLSTASAAPMAGPMQAMKKGTREKYINEIAGNDSSEEEVARLRGMKDKDLKKEYKSYQKQMRLAEHNLDAMEYYNAAENVQNKLEDEDENDNNIMAVTVHPKYMGRAYGKRYVKFAKQMLAEREKLNQQRQNGNLQGKDDEDLDLMATTGETGTRFLDFEAVGSALDTANMREHNAGSGAVRK